MKANKAGGGKGGAPPNPHATHAAETAAQNTFTQRAAAAHLGAPVQHYSGQVTMEVNSTTPTADHPYSSFPHLSSPHPHATPGTPGYHQHITDIRQNAVATALPQMYDAHDGRGEQPPPVGATAFVIHDRTHQPLDPAGNPAGGVVVDRQIATQPAPGANGMHQAVSAAVQQARGSGRGAVGSADSPAYVRVYTASQAGVPLSPRSQGRT